MEFKFLRPPPPLSHHRSWRALYESGAFGQRELATMSRFDGGARDRSFRIGNRREAYEDLDMAGALQPIAFVEGGYSIGYSVPAEPVENLSFREEEGPTQWSRYEWDFNDRPQVTPLYSAWQLLYVDDVLDGTGADLALETALADTAARDRVLEQLRPWLQDQDSAWRAIDDAWRPLLKLLVRLQNRYWPQVTNRVAMIQGPEPGDWAEAGGETPEDAQFDPSAALRDLGAITTNWRPFTTSSSSEGSTVTRVTV